MIKNIGFSRKGITLCCLGIFCLTSLPTIPLEAVEPVEAAPAFQSKKKPTTTRRRTTRRRSSSRRRASRARSNANPAPPFDKVMSENRELVSAGASAEMVTTAIDDHSLRAHVKFLSDDMLEGRGSGSRGGMLAAKYIATQFESLGLEPASPDGSYFQQVQLVGSRTDPATKLTFKGPAGAATELSFGDQFVAGNDLEQTETTVNGEVVFVGYGISSPENNWDDFKGVDLRGRILVMLVNDPPATASEPNLFGGRALTYYGRWTYKFEEAARRGAAGAILVHTNESAGYGWSVVRNSWTGERFSLLPDAGTQPLRLKAWVTEDSARQILQLGSQNLDQLRQAATSRDFRPVTLTAQLTTSLRTQVQRMSSPNVVAIHRGSDPTLKNQVVVYSSHWDHLGIRPDQPGDNVYNGAVDNATGVAGLLAIARACSSLGTRPRRSILFIATTAEEQGLLGSEYYVHKPLIPLSETIANINLDSLNVLGTTTDFVPLGASRSTIAKIVDEVAKEAGLTVAPEANPEQGSFYRSDHFPFAKAGIPAISLQPGTRFVGHSDSWGQEQRAEFIQYRYHQPGDEYSPNWDFNGAVQQVRLALAIGLRLANVSEVPQWNPGDEFARKDRRP